MKGCGGGIIYIFFELYGWTGKVGRFENGGEKSGRFFWCRGNGPSSLTIFVGKFLVNFWGGVTT